MTAGYWQVNYFTTNYWHENYWQDYGVPGPSEGTYGKRRIRYIASWHEYAGGRK